MTTLNLVKHILDATHIQAPMVRKKSAGGAIAMSKFLGASKSIRFTETENDVEDDFVAHFGTRGFRRWCGLKRNDWHCRRWKGEKHGNDDDGDDDEWARREAFRE